LATLVSQPEFQILIMLISVPIMKMLNCYYSATAAEMHFHLKNTTEKEDVTERCTKTLSLLRSKGHCYLEVTFKAMFRAESVMRSIFASRVESLLNKSASWAVFPMAISKRLNNLFISCSCIASLSLNCCDTSDRSQYCLLRRNAKAKLRSVLALSVKAASSERSPMELGFDSRLISI
ncbi:hypothetical protein T4A_9934, partial [Trichinella pseudospiralis]